MKHLDGTGRFLAGAALLVGMLVFGVALGRVLSGGPSTSDGSAGAVSMAGIPPAFQVPGSAEFAGSVPRGVLRLAAAEAPFDENRRPPPRRYRMPGNESRAPAEEPVELPPPPDFTLLGVVSSSSEGGLAVLRVGDEEPRLVSVGESIDGYTLSSVEGERAIMAGLGRTLQVPLSTPSSRVDDDDDDDDDDDRRRRRDRDDDDDDDDEDDEERAERAAEALRRALEARRQLQEQLRRPGNPLGADPFRFYPGGRRVLINP